MSRRVTAEWQSSLEVASRTLGYVLPGSLHQTCATGLNLPQPLTFRDLRGAWTTWAENRRRDPFKRPSLLLTTPGWSSRRPGHDDG